MKLMIVDDHGETRRLIRELASPLAAEICECASGEEAVRRCEDFRPDFVTMDLHMQPMDGLEAARQIAAAYPSARVVVVTRSDFAELRTDVLRIGNQLIVMKEDLGRLRGYLESPLA